MITASFALLFIFLCLIFFDLYRRNFLIWLPAYIRGSFRRKPKYTGPLHILFCFVDHFEPGWQKPDLETERARVARWCRDYPAMADRHRDADGRPPQHTFFYPEEEYREEHLAALSDLCARGYGEIEVHLHHDRDTEEGLRAKIHGFIAKLVENHNALPRDKDTGEIRFAFIHGNWALDNSRKDGRWCGVNNEIQILRELGCYADFTLPSAPSDTQTSKINSLYYALDNPSCPKSHNNGVDVDAGESTSGDLMLIQGPLTLNWQHRKFGILPHIENADVRSSMQPTSERIDLWIKTHIHVKGRPEWCFVKIHTHGSQEKDMDTLLGPAIDKMHSDLERKYNDGQRYILHYVTSREMYNIAKAAEHGCMGNPNVYRNYHLTPPQYRLLNYNPR